MHNNAFQRTRKSGAPLKAGVGRQEWSARVKLPNVTTHAAIHVVVENQIAEGLDPVVRAMVRLMREGLSRHEALHAIGCVVAEHSFEALNTDDQNFINTAQARYNAAVERLTAESWRQEYGAE